MIKLVLVLVLAFEQEELGLGLGLVQMLERVRVLVPCWKLPGSKLVGQQRHTCAMSW